MPSVKYFVCCGMDVHKKFVAAIVDDIPAYETFDPEHCKSPLLKKERDKADVVVKSIISYELRGDQSVEIQVCRRHFDYINECVVTLEETISDLSKPYHSFIDLAITIPGVTDQSSAFIIAEIEVDMETFKSSKRLCSWVGTDLPLAVRTAIPLIKTQFTII